jgi:hypothetical protein
VSSSHPGAKTRFLLLSDSCGFVDVGRLLRREDGSVVYNCCWPSPAQSSLGQSPAGLVTIFYYLRFNNFPTWRISPRMTEWPSYTPRHRVPFSSPPTTRRARWRYSTPPPRGDNCNLRSKSESKLLYDGRFTSNQFILALSPLRITTICVQLRPL